jgi:class 3 adenylate cyclase
MGSDYRDLGNNSRLLGSQPPCNSWFWRSIMQRTLIALWFADIVGYSAHAAKDEAGALRLVEILQALSRETVPRYKGRVVKFVGDAVLAEFPSAELAVRAAARLSSQFTERRDEASILQHHKRPSRGKRKEPRNSLSGRAALRRPQRAARSGILRRRCS